MTMSMSARIRAMYRLSSTSNSPSAVATENFGTATDEENICQPKRLAVSSPRRLIGMASCTIRIKATTATAIGGDLRQLRTTRRYRSSASTLVYRVVAFSIERRRSIYRPTKPSWIHS